MPSPCPRQYLDLLRACNGGYAEEDFFPVPMLDGSPQDGVEVRQVFGFGGDEGLDSEEFGVKALRKEWGYPKRCIRFAEGSFGPEAALLFDYRQCSENPPILYWDCDLNDGRGQGHIIADSFHELLAGLIADPDRA